MGSSEAGFTFRFVPSVSEVANSLSRLTSHWIQPALGRGSDFGWEDSAVEALPREGSPQSFQVVGSQFFIPEVGIWVTQCSIHNENQARSSRGEQLCFPLWWLVVFNEDRIMAWMVIEIIPFLDLQHCHTKFWDPRRCAVDVASRVLAGELPKDSSSDWVNLFAFNKPCVLLHSVLCNLAIFPL